MRFVQAVDGEWIQPIRLGYKIACCDCGLVHRFDFKIVGGRVVFRAFRDARSTAARRRGASLTISKAKKKALHAEYKAGAVETLTLLVAEQRQQIADLRRLVGMQQRIINAKRRAEAQDVPNRHDLNDQSKP